MFSFPETPCSFLPFSAEVYSHDGLHELLLAAQLAPDSKPQPPPRNELVIGELAAMKMATGGGVGRKTSMRKDRHSKIFTAQGIRDRRMRLSLAVARPFFELQEMLGFDKPSKTLQWLLSKSKAAIKDLATISTPSSRQSLSSPKNESSASECDVLSTGGSDHKGKSPVIAVEGKVTKSRKAAVQSARKGTTDPAVARESRTKARARARERTKEKIRMKFGNLADESETNPPVPASAMGLEAVEESGSHELKSSLDFVADVDELCSHTPSDGNYMQHVTEPMHQCAALNNSSSSNFNYNQSIVSRNHTINLLQESWDMHYFTDNPENREYHGDAQLHARLWANHNPIL